MNNNENATHSLASALVASEAGVSIPAGDYYFVPTTQINGEHDRWPYFFEQEGPTVELADGTLISQEKFAHYSKIQNDTQFDGNDHGFHYGIALRPASYFSTEDLAFLLEHKLIFAHTVAEDSVLFDVESLPANLYSELQPHEELIYGLFSATGIIDTNDILVEAYNA